MWRRICAVKTTSQHMIHVLGKDLLVCKVQAGKIYICSALNMRGLIYGHADILRSARCAQRLYSPYLLISKKIKELSLLSQII